MIKSMELIVPESLRACSWKEKKTIIKLDYNAQAMINAGAAELEMSVLRIFLTVIEERSFSRAAAKVHRTQPAVSQAVRRLELQLGEQLFDRSSKTGTLTEAGRMLQNYGQRLVRLAEETESAVRDLRDLRRGRVLIGANEAAVHTLLPVVSRFRQRYPDIAIDVRRVL